MTFNKVIGVICAVAKRKAGLDQSLFPVQLF